ncbi:glycosyltransferase family 2 protein [Aquirufa ecclesiirivi]
MRPLISIIITSYNRSYIIATALDSVLMQDYENLEIIVIDNCSTDETDEVISKYLIDSRVRYIKNEVNIGAVPSLIKAVELCNGTYFTHVSSDDRLINNSFISDAVELINKYPTMVVLTAKNIFFNETTKAYRFPDSYKNSKFYDRECVNGKEVFLEYMNSYPVTMGASLLRRKEFIGLKDQKAAPIYYDLQIIMQLLLLGDVGFMDKEAYLVTLHDKNLSSTLHKAEKNIENALFIEMPYQQALEGNSFSEEVISEWHEKMLAQYLFYILADYYKRDKGEFNKFSNYAQQHFPKIIVQITKKPNWKLIMVIFKFQFIGESFVGLKNLAKKILKPFLGKISRKY